MDIYTFCTENDVEAPEILAELRGALNLVMDGGGNHTDARKLEYMGDNAWVGDAAERESFAIADLRKVIMATGVPVGIANKMISAIWRPEQTANREVGYGRVRLRMDEVCLYLFDKFMYPGWDTHMSEGAQWHLATLRKIVSHIPEPRRIIVYSHEKTGWWVLEGTRKVKK